MKRVLSIACLLFCVTLTLSLSAQTPQTTPPTAGAPTAGMKITTEAEFATHMKEIQQQNGILNKALKGGMNDEATKAAARLEVLFTNIHGYWSGRKVEDATTAAQTAVTSLQQIQKAIAANDMTAAQTARATFAGTCKTCHSVHREEIPGGGGYRMK